MTPSEVSLATLERAIYATAVSTSMPLKVNTHATIIQTIVQPVCKTSAPTTAKLKLNDAQPPSRATGVNACSTERLVFSKSYKGKAVDAININVCTHKRKCPQCRTNLVGMKEQRKHQCGFVDCPLCHEYVNAREHKCFI